MYDIIVIGGGPVGLFAAYYAGMRQAKVLVIENLATLGGQVSALYPEKTIYDIGGIPRILGKDLIKAQTDQLQLFPPTIKTGLTVNGLDREKEYFNVHTAQGNSFKGKKVILATGAGAFSPRKLAVEHVEDFKQHVHYFLENPKTYQGKIVAIAGGGDSALESALTLSPFARQIYLIHRRAQFRALESTVQQISQAREPINIMTPYLIKQLSYTASNQLTLHLKKVRTDEPLLTLPVDELFVHYGFTSDTQFLHVDNLEQTAQGFVVDRDMSTNQAGVYAIGDIADYPGKIDLIAVGYSEATLAVNHALNELHPDHYSPLHSTSLTFHNA